MTTNTDRAMLACECLALVATETGLDLDIDDEQVMAFRDLLTNMMHCAGRIPNLNFDEQLEIARRNYEAEKRLIDHLNEALKAAP